MKQEIWKEYKTTHKATWEVSNYGNVKKNGELYECGLNRGYKRFHDGKYLHKVVAKLFIPNPENKKEVDHIDTNKLNNHVDNLRWCTHKENCNNQKTRQHLSEAGKDRKQTEESKRKISETKKGKYTGEKHNRAKKCPYNGIVFGCIKDAYDYAVKCDGYNKSLSTFCRHNKD